MPGPTELIVILLIVIVVFGAKKLPELGKGLGKGIKEFKDASEKGQEGNKKGVEDKKESDSE